MEEQKDSINPQYIYNALIVMTDHIKAIKNWITFMGTLLLIGLLLSIFGGCMALL